MTTEGLDRIEARLCAITDTIVITNRDEAKRASRLWDWAVNHGQPLIAALRESMARERWIPVSERLPDVGPCKDGDKGWMVANGRRLWFETMHPSYWNKRDDDNSTITHWKEIHGPEGE